LARKWITPNIVNTKCDAALHQILDPIGLSYELVYNKVVLKLKEQDLNLLSNRVSLGPADYACFPGAPSDKIPVEYAVILVLEQIKLVYDWDLSLHNVGDLAKQWITPNIVDTECNVALHQMLDPLRLGYEFVNDKLVLWFKDRKRFLNSKVSLGPTDYTCCYPGAPSDKISVEYAVLLILKQVKLMYDWNLSLYHAGYLTRKWITPNIVDTECNVALHQILDPIGLGYEFINNKLVLKVKEPDREHLLNSKVSLGPADYVCYPGAPSDKISVEYAVLLVLQQVKLVYDWDLSKHNVGDLAESWITPNIVDTECNVALHQILDPIRLGYEFVNNKIALNLNVSKAATGGKLKN
jgi:hypothetical protein